MKPVFRPVPRPAPRGEITAVVARNCPTCGKPQVRVDRAEAKAGPREWACGSCGRIDLTEKWPTPRELDVIKGICDGKGAKEIAVELNLSTKTVETHRSNAMRKLMVHCTAMLVRWAIREGIVEA